MLECNRYTFHDSPDSIALVSNPKNSRDIKYRMQDMLKECLSCPLKTDDCTEELQQEFFDAFQANRLRLLGQTPKTDE